MELLDRSLLAHIIELREVIDGGDDVPERPRVTLERQNWDLAPDIQFDPVCWLKAHQRGTVSRRAVQNNLVERVRHRAQPYRAVVIQSRHAIAKLAQSGVVVSELSRCQASLLFMPRKTVSIASAPGWKARFLADSGAEGVRAVTLVSWALVEDSDGTTAIVGVVQRSPTAEAPHGWFGFADEVDGFDGYTFTGVRTQALEN